MVDSGLLIDHGVAIHVAVIGCKRNRIGSGTHTRSRFGGVRQPHIGVGVKILTGFQGVVPGNVIRETFIGGRACQTRGIPYGQQFVLGAGVVCFCFVIVDETAIAQKQPSVPGTGHHGFHTEIAGILLERGILGRVGEQTA